MTSLPFSEDHADTAQRDAYWRRLCHRWFVQYNPLYLLSAALVLAGVNLIADGASRHEGLVAQFGGAAIAEGYAWCLIGAAAWLTRRGLRRSGVMLALLAVLYQGDVTLHTSTSAHLGGAGVVAEAVWLTSFLGKLLSLGWAVHLRPSPSALAVTGLGGLGLVLLPHLVQSGGHVAGSWVIGWFFGVFALALWSSREVSSTTPLDPWGHTVLRRSVRGTWLLWALCFLAHMLLWISDLGNLPVLLPAVLLLSTRFAKSEAQVWGIVAVSLLLTQAYMPAIFWPVSAMSAIVLMLRAVRKPVRVVDASARTDHGPYRTSEAAASPFPTTRQTFVWETRAAVVRLTSGAVVALYLAAWTMNWRWAPWPDHVLALDLLFTALVALLVWKARARAVLVPLAATWGHVAIQAHRIEAPSGGAQWGASAVAAGFIILVVGLVANWRLGGRHPPAAEAQAPR